MAVSQVKMTIEEFIRLPEEKPALEYVNGIVSQKVSPGGRHSRLQAVIAEQINPNAVRDKLAMAFPELRFTFGGHSYVPDIAVLRWDHIPVQTDGRIGNDLFGPPDIAVEIVSPEQSVNALVRRCVWYVEHGVQIALLVDPADESVVLFRNGQSPLILTSDNRIDLDDVLVDFSLSVRELFDSLRID